MILPLLHPFYFELASDFCTVKTILCINKLCLKLYFVLNNLFGDNCRSHHDDIQQGIDLPECHNGRHFRTPNRPKKLSSKFEPKRNSVWRRFRLNPNEGRFLSSSLSLQGRKKCDVKKLDRSFTFAVELRPSQDLCQPPAHVQAWKTVLAYIGISSFSHHHILPGESVLITVISEWK